ncbi:helix-turn-helix transcriptional regulator [Xanthobacter versatilis]|uniref:helix-turn-helix transcriptional regulator n=1 Tax=Xanthobacter autotrophicus (strain ATCC BAA-1158 / Py2) TaxID=78245 RepID=UPI00372B5546
MAVNMKIEKIKLHHDLAACANRSEAANDNDRLMRLPEILQLIPISRSAFYAGIKAGIYPKPLKLGARTSAWKVSDILALIERGTPRC